MKKQHQIILAFGLFLAIGVQCLLPFILHSTNETNLVSIGYEEIGQEFDVEESDAHLICFEFFVAEYKFALKNYDEYNVAFHNTQSLKHRKDVPPYIVLRRLKIDC